MTMHEYQYFICPVVSIYTLGLIRKLLSKECNNICIQTNFYKDFVKLQQFTVNKKLFCSLKTGLGISNFVP